MRLKMRWFDRKSFLVPICNYLQQQIQKNKLKAVLNNKKTLQKHLEQNKYNQKYNNNINTNQILTFLNTQLRIELENV